MGVEAIGYPVPEQRTERPPSRPGDLDVWPTQRMCRLAVQLLRVGGASVVVVGREGAQQLVHASDETVARLDELQLSLGEGPCRDAFESRHPVLVPDLDSTAAVGQWPRFAGAALQAGARAVFAFPLHIGSIPFGIVEFYGRSRGPLDDLQLATALLLVDDLVRVVLDDLAGNGQPTTTTGSSAPLFGRADLVQATALISDQLGTSIPDALAQLRTHAFTERRSITEIAGDVLARRYTFINSSPETPG